MKRAIVKGMPRTMFVVTDDGQVREESFETFLLKIQVGTIVPLRVAGVFAKEADANALALVVAPLPPSGPLGAPDGGLRAFATDAKRVAVKAQPYGNSSSKVYIASVIDLMRKEPAWRSVSESKMKEMFSEAQADGLLRLNRIDLAVRGDEDVQARSEARPC